MAKKAKQPIEDMDEVAEKKTSKIQWFLFVCIIPLIFAILVIVIVLSLTGGNVFEKVKDVSTQVTQVFQGEEKETEKTVSEYKKETIDLQAEIKNKEEEIKSLESVIDSRDKRIQQAEAEKQKLQKELDDLKKNQSTSQNTPTPTTNATSNASDVVKTYEVMSPKKSAPIFTQMSDTDAVAILSSFKADTLAKVLEQMTPEDAARLTARLKTNTP